MKMDRRQLGGMCGGAAAFVGLSAAGFPVWAAMARPDQRALLGAVFARMFPLQKLDQGVYQRLAADLLARGDADPDLSKTLTVGMAVLEGEGDWQKLTPAAQTATLRAMEGTPFFAVVLASARGLYGLPEVWARIGYGGSAVEHGGYIDRGFDDIDWLPAN